MNAPTLMLALALSASLLQAVPTEQYLFGNPTAEEQEILERLNRARANPVAEGDWLFSVTTPRIQAYDAGYATPGSPWTRPAVRSAFYALAPRPPLAWNAILLEAALIRAKDQVDNDYYGQQNPTTGQNGQLGTQMGFPGDTFTELNSTAFAPLEHHVVMGIDYGTPSLGHRNARMSQAIAPDPADSRKEVGLASYCGIKNLNSDRSPYRGVEMYGHHYSEPFAGYTAERFFIPILTGVVFEDLNADGTFTAGEGLGGIRVTPSVGRYYAVTSTSGGYSIPLEQLPPGTTTVDVTFSGGALGATTVTRTVTLGTGNATGENRKLDLQVAAGTRPKARVVNLSTRLRTEPGNNVAIGGFVVAGGPKTVVVRALGPSLAANIPNQPVVADPTLTLINDAGVTVGTNNDWRQDPEATRIQQARLAPPSEKEAALLVTLPAGAYTVLVRDAANAAARAITLFEVYAVDELAPEALTGRSDAATAAAAAGDPVGRLKNVSTRGVTRVGDNVLIGGFVIGGEQSKRVAVRAVSSSLAAYGVPDLANRPTVRIASANELRRSVAFLNPAGPYYSHFFDQLDSVQLPLTRGGNEVGGVFNLFPGAYTVIVDPAGGEGNVLIEIYDAD